MELVLEDKFGNQVAEILVEFCKDDLVTGLIVKDGFSFEQKQCFKDFEELVNHQVLSLIDNASKKIESHQFKIRSRNWIIYDIQVFEKNKISFRIIKELKN